MNRRHEIPPAPAPARARTAAWILILGLLASGATAIPIPQQFRWAAARLGDDFSAGGRIPAAVASWLRQAWLGIESADAGFPQVWYGTDWLAYGHLAMAVVVAGTLRDPVRCRDVYRSCMVVGLLVIPWALVFGALRGIPIWWRLVDGAFGIAGFIPAWLAYRWTATPGGTAAQPPDS